MSTFNLVRRNKYVFACALQIVCIYFPTQLTDDDDDELTVVVVILSIVQSPAAGVAAALRI